MSTLLGLIPALVLLVAITAKKQAIIVVTCGVMLTILVIFPSESGRGSFAPGPTQLTLVALALVAILTMPRAFPLSFVPLVVFVGLALGFVWSGGTGEPGGLLTIAGAVVAMVAGRFLALKVQGLSNLRTYAERTIAWLLLCAVVFELVVTVLQQLGFGVFALEGRTFDLEGGRASGTFGHPSVIGKVFTLILMVLLPLTRSKDGVTSRVALIASLGTVLPIALSQSRANLVSVLAMLLVWVVLQPRESGRAFQRIIIPLGAGAIVLAFLDQILLRFNADPAGGQREHFLDVALLQLAQNPWAGVGPAGYVREVGRFDPLTAQGWPVHNIFVLEAVELGVIGAVFLFLPIVLVFARSIRRVRSRSAGGDNARAALAYLPAFIIIGVTGWGLMSPATSVLLFFVFGYVSVMLNELEPAGQVKPHQLTLHSRSSRAHVRTNRIEGSV